MGAMGQVVHRRTLVRRFLGVAAVWGAGSEMRGAQAATALPVLLARDAPKGLNPAGYLVSEKLDGVRALWDGVGLFFRSGRAIAAPAWFTAKLPAMALDGELWMGRGTFDALSGAVRRNVPDDAEWRKVTYMVFDAPQAAGSFAQRAAMLQDSLPKQEWPQLQAVQQVRLANPAALHSKLRAVTREGGEGLVLHKADAPVVGGRSDLLLKLKPVQDAEALVLGHVAGKGKFTGMLGALDVRTEDGKRFLLGTGFTDAQRRNPPPLGSTVTYAYRDLTSKGVPRFASFLRVYTEQ